MKLKVVKWIYEGDEVIYNLLKKHSLSLGQHEPGEKLQGGSRKIPEIYRMAIKMSVRWYK